MFSMAILVSLQIAGKPFDIQAVIITVSSYSILVLARIFIFREKIFYADFILDIFFISTLLYISFDVYSVLTLLYLVPIFFSSIMIPSRKSLFFPALSFLLYAMINYMQGFFVQKDTILDLSLHFLSFSFIALAGNAMKERIEMQIKQIEKLKEDKIKMEGYKRLYGISADLAHELRNPLTSISASVQFLKEGRNERDFLDMLSSETERLSKLVNDFLMFSRPADANKEDIDISELLNYLNGKIHSDKEIELKLFEPHVLIKANRTFIESALNNIVINAVQAAETKVLITLKRLFDAAGMESNASDRFVICIEDDGNGIKDAVKDKIFEPFVTTKPHGTGLGLAIAERIIKSLDGDIIVGKSEMGGAKFTVVLPMQKRNLCMR